MPKTWKRVHPPADTEPIAESWWEYDERGRKVVSRVAIGRPQPHPSGEAWYCPVLIEGYWSKWHAVYGVGALDALMNAVNLCSRFFHEHSTRITDIRDSKLPKPKPRGARRR
jgi:hypothetical protein